MRYGKKTRKDWRITCWESTLSKSVDPTCQNNNSCEYCRSNRLYASTKQEQKAIFSLKEYHNADNSGIDIPIS